MAQQIRVLILGESHLLVEGLVSLLCAQDIIALVGVTADWSEATVMGRLSEIDLIVIDVHSNNDSVELRRKVRRLREELEHTRVMVLGIGDEDIDLLQLIEAGISGYSLKSESFAQILRKIEGIAKQQIVCSPRVASSVFSRITELSQSRVRGVAPQPFTQREREILSLLAQGLSNKDISNALNIALNTVKNHVHNILDKMRVHRRREAIRRAVEGGLLLSPAARQVNGRNAIARKEVVIMNGRRSNLGTG
jgi:DNA-binding NarL/FixJ family response regulator